MSGAEPWLPCVQTLDPLKRVAFLLEWLPEYRVQFFEGLRATLHDDGIDLEVLYANPGAEVAGHRDARSLAWGTTAESRYVRVGQRHVVLQDWRQLDGHLDLIVVNEGARLLSNYVLLTRQATGGTRVAFWGHGANLDNVTRRPGTELFKKVLYRWPGWWFAYTDGSLDRLVKAGYPRERATVVYNSTSSERLRRDVATAAEEEIALRSELLLGKRRVGLFLGSLRETRRLPFLLEASDRIVEEVPDFVLVIAGEGRERGHIESLARERLHVVLTGRVDGMRKAALLRAAEVMLLPGHIGLNLVDGFAADLPTLTTAVPRHAPEVEYLDNGVNGLILPADSSPTEYAAAVAGVLGQGPQLQTLSRGARETGRIYTEENMVERFANGIRAAIDTV